MYEPLSQPAASFLSQRRLWAVVGFAAFCAFLLTYFYSNSSDSESTFLGIGRSYQNRSRIQDVLAIEENPSDFANPDVLPDEPEGEDDEQEEESEVHIEDGEDEEDDPGFEPAPRTHKGPYNEIKPGERYFLYSPSGGFNNQREELAYAMEICRVLNRTLYVPMAGRHTQFFSAYERLSGPMDLFSMDRILDFPYMETYGIKVVPLNTTVLRMVARFIHQMGQDKVEVLYHTEKPSVIESWHMPEILAMRSIKKPLLFIRGRGFYHRWFPTSTLTKIRTHIRYSEYLRKLSIKIVEQSIGKEFYAMHVRLGDYKVRYGDHVAAFIGGLMRAGWNRGWKPKKYPLYLATDDARKSNDEFHSIFHAFSKIYYAETIPKHLVQEFRSMFPPRSKMKDDMMGILEQLICAQAMDFVGTPTSTFSAWINFMRALRKYAFPEIGAVGSETRGADGDGGDSSNNNHNSENKSMSIWK